MTGQNIQIRIPVWGLFITLIVLAILSFGIQSSAAVSQPMYEYKIVLIPVNANAWYTENTQLRIENALNENGQEGWKMVTTRHVRRKIIGAMEVIMIRER